MARTAQDLRTVIQPRIDAGDDNAQIKTWLRELVGRADVENDDYDEWLGPPDNILARLEQRREELRVLIEGNRQNVSVTTQDEWNAISQMVNWAQKEGPVPLARDTARTTVNTLAGDVVFSDVKRDQLFAFSDGKIPRWQVSDPVVWPATEGEIQTARELP